MAREGSQSQPHLERETCGQSPGAHTTAVPMPTLVLRDSGPGSRTAQHQGWGREGREGEGAGSDQSRALGIA